MRGHLLAGVDCSTQATKVALVDPADGRLVALGRAPHIVTGRDGAREADPNVWWTALRSALAKTGRARDVAAIAVGGQQHGLVVLDGQGRALRPAILWNDTRSARDARALIAALGGPGRWAELVGSVPSASFTVTSWAWLRHEEPDLAAVTKAIRLPHDYLTERLTGQGVTDRGDASGTGWWSPANGTYVGEILDHPLVKLDEAMLPAVLGPGSAAGRVRAVAAEELGLSPGTLVAAGTGDNMAAALGLGIEPGVPVLSLGTSGTVYLVSERPAADPSGIVAGFADATGRYLPLACTLNCTLAVNRVAEWLGLEREAVLPSESAVVLPFFDGERTPNLPSASATITGLRHGTERGAILGATYEGAVASLLEALDALDQHSSGLRPEAPIVLIGGGAQGQAWRATVSRLSGRALRVPDAVELVALGAAAQAAALNEETPVETIARRWDTLRGTDVPPQGRDDETMERIRQVRVATEHLDSLPG